MLLRNIFRSIYPTMRAVTAGPDLTLGRVWVLLPTGITPAEQGSPVTVRGPCTVPQPPVALRVFRVSIPQEPHGTSAGAAPSSVLSKCIKPDLTKPSSNTAPPLGDLSRALELLQLKERKGKATLP